MEDIKRMVDRFPPPWTVRCNDDAYWVEDAGGSRFAYCYFRDAQSIGTGRGYLSRDAARRIASNVAKLPELLAGRKMAKSDASVARRPGGEQVSNDDVQPLPDDQGSR